MLNNEQYEIINNLYEYYCNNVEFLQRFYLDCNYISYELFGKLRAQLDLDLIEQIKKVIGKNNLYIKNLSDIDYHKELKVTFTSNELIQKIDKIM